MELCDLIYLVNSVLVKIIHTKKYSKKKITGILQGDLQAKFIIVLQLAKHCKPREINIKKIYKP